MKQFISLSCVLLAATYALTAQDIPENILENIPEELTETLLSGAFAQRYVIDTSINPFYLRGDFDGDAKPDYAVRVRSRKSQEVGIAIWLSSARRFTILGAGTKFDVSGGAATDLSFLDTWQVYPRKPVERGVDAGPPPRLRGEAILAGKSESASGLIYWNGRSFVWYQQGD
jgi:hypothetical protein